ncbi:hypothetical protein ONE63_010516 [Megalurothrips usitatus]|uniref:F-box domain-containing protein n=1 Tax=Megalurothrips usitatus TaxID=439358 RepID=A0AAV7XGT8_9NEOP|nr:hypothetical protein ONE63_010516 [Megalurothrips usitatus]
MSDLLSLPDELLVMILDYCSTLDLIEISRVCKKLNDITCDRNLVKVCNFHFQTKIQQNLLKSFISYRPRAENVTTIDLTSCYWLTSSFINDLVSRLRQVENVLVADTALRPNHLKQLMLTLSQIKRLSWTWRQGMDDEGIEEPLQRLKFLFLCLKESKRNKTLDGVVKLVNRCTELHELWINNIDPQAFIKSGNSIQLEHLENIVLYPCPSWPLIKSQANLKQIWRSNPSVINLGEAQILSIESLLTSRWRDISHIVQLGALKIQKLCCREPFGTNIGEVLSALRDLKALHIVLPACIEANSMIVDTLHLNELSLDVKNSYQECSTRFCEVAACCRELKFIHLPAQAIVCKLKEGVEPSTSRARVSRISEELECGVETPFKKMVLSTPYVEVCEIGVLRKSPGPNTKPNNLEWDMRSLSAISQWKCLTSLTLANLPIRQGKFLQDILKDCRMLKTLKIADLGHESRCLYSNDLYSALPFSRLEDFHWTQSYVGSTSRLWTALQTIPTLQRVALCLEGESSVNEQDIYTTMEKCQSLYFLHVATCSTKVRCRLIKNNLTSRWSETRPHLCVWFGVPREYTDAAESSPIVHAGEMLQDFSRIKGFPVSSTRFLSFGKRAWAPHM